ncbi:MAG: putative Spermine/spermidine synthase family protein [Hyphomicrobiales bacterium]|nr:putative Spermine/spermidine synthase family protein [Hyphomicrobiales bacterium]
MTMRADARVNHGNELGRGRRAWSIAPVVLMSGFAGLGYEIVWTRALSSVLGTEMMAALGVLAGFFCGLALGAFLLDGPIRRARSPHKAYAILELIIATWGVVSIWLLPRAGLAVSPLLGTDPSPLALWGACFLLPAVILLPATAAMGGTLTALERMIGNSASGPAASGVYGINTAGAVLGTLFATFLLLPAFGLSATLLCLVAVNIGCALSALAIRLPVSGAKEARAQRAASGSTNTRLRITLFCTGLLGIAFEVLIIRLASQVMQDTVYTFAGLLVAYLLGAAGGSLAWQRLGDSAAKTSIGPLLCAAATTCLLTAFIAPHAAHIARASSDLGITGEIALALALFLLPSAAMGALFGFLAQQVRNESGSIGSAVAINGIGAAFAPLLTTQVLIPVLGVWLALVPVALGYLLLMPTRRSSLSWSVAPLIAGLFLLMNPAPPLSLVPAGGQLLALREGSMVTASVVDDPEGVRYLEVNGRFRMGGTSSVRSDFRQGVLPLLLHPAPQRALFLGLGTGATLVGGSRMPGVTAKGVELSQEVVDLMPWFIDRADASRLAPITVADARRYVLADQEKHDVIVADLFHPALDGSGALYTVEHFAAVRERLSAGGVFCQWLPLYQLDLPSLSAIIRSFLKVYPGGSAWLNHFSVGTPMLALIGPRDDRLDLSGLERALSDPGKQHIVSSLGFHTPIDVLGQYVGGPQALNAFAGAGPLNTDDHPFVIFDAMRNVEALNAPPWSLLMAVIRKMKPNAAELPPLVGYDASRLAAYWAARDRFLETGAALQGQPRGRALIAAAAPGLFDSIRISDEFDPAYDPLIAMASALMQDDRQAGVRLLEKIVSAAPSRPEARALLARERLKPGGPDEPGVSR